jgi:hypothetical protein
MMGLQLVASGVVLSSKELVRGLLNLCTVEKYATFQSSGSFTLLYVARGLF